MHTQCFMSDLVNISAKIRGWYHLLIISILAPIDGSDHAEKALDYALNMARAPRLSGVKLEYDHMTQSFALVSYITIGFTVPCAHHFLLTSMRARISTQNRVSKFCARERALTVSHFSVTIIVVKMRAAQFPFFLFLFLYFLDVVKFMLPSYFFKTTLK